MFPCDTRLMIYSCLHWTLNFLYIHPSGEILCGSFIKNNVNVIDLLYILYILLHRFPEDTKYAEWMYNGYSTSWLSVCMFQLLNYSTDFDQIWCHMSIILYRCLANFSFSLSVFYDIVKPVHFFQLALRTHIRVRRCTQKFPDWVVTKYTLTTLNTHLEAT
jgi:hypothetical protein